MERTTSGTPPRVVESIAQSFQVVVQVTGEEPQAHELGGEHVRIGRAPDNDIVLPAEFVSRYVADLQRTEEGYRLTSAPGATPPLTLRGRLITGSINLAAGDYFRMVGPNAGEMLTIIYTTSEEVSRPTDGVLPLDPSVTIRIGSGEGTDLGLGNPTLDSLQAEIEFAGGGLLLIPHGKGLVRINGQATSQPHPLQPADIIQLGNLRLRVGADGLEYHDPAAQWLAGRRRARSVPDDLLARMEGTGGAQVEALHLHKRVRHGVDLLQDISLRIRPRELVVVVGLSGAGKSTLLDALAGYRRATSGDVRVNSAQLYRHFDRFRTEIGFVPQRDIIHRDLTVSEALEYVARLRLPPDTDKDYRQQRIDEVLRDLDLQERRDVRVRDLSGGQQKRVSIGVELITSPQLFFLDEPTSGLDPGTETGLMQLLRRLADQGRTVIMITHATKNVMLADKVAFMVRGGHLAWYGPPREALLYFNRQRPAVERENGDLAFDGIYALLDDPTRGSPQEWADRYVNDPAFDKYIAAPLHLRPSPEEEQRPPPADPPPRARQISAFRQFYILSDRNLKLIFRDRIALALMLLAAPVLASFDFLLTSRHMYDPTLGDPLKATIGAATLATSSVLVGALSQAREIIKDSDVYRRERLVNLKLVPYVLSKVWIAVLLALYQAVAWLGMRYIAVQMPDGVHVATGIYVTLVLTILAGMMLGLFASALAPTEQSVTMLVALLIVPQILFNGSFLPIAKLSPVGQAMSAVMATRWSFGTIITQTEMGKDVALDPGWKLPVAKRLALTDAQTRRDRCLGLHIFSECNFPGIRAFYRPAVNAPAPPRPQLPGPAATKVQQATYQRKVASYQQAYASWEAARSKPIAAAEAVLQEEKDKFGDAYNVNVVQHWLILIGINVVLILGILGVQKAKDRV